MSTILVLLQKVQTIYLYLYNPKIMNQFCFIKSTSTLRVQISVLSCRWPKRKWINFFQVYHLYLGKLAKTQIMVDSHFENSPDNVL